MAADVPEILKTLIEALPDGVFVHAPGRGILYANAAFRTFIGGDDLLGLPAEDVLHPDDRLAARDRIRRVLETGQPTGPHALRFMRRDGSCIDGESRGVTYPIAGEALRVVVVRDLTESQRSQRALARSEAVFHTLIEDLQIGVLVQGPAAEILVSNRAALDLLGLDEAQLLGKTSFDPDWNVTHEDGSVFPGSEHPVPVAIRTRRPVRDVVMCVHRPSRNDNVWLHVNAEPQLDTEGSLVQVVCTFSDFTTRHRMEAQTAASDRMASLGRLAAGVAHEINNPLAYVIGHLETLRNAKLDEALSTTVNEALEGAERVRVIVRDLRSLSRADDEQLGPVDLVQVIDAACNIATAQVRHRARLVRNLGHLPKVEGNASRLGQLVLNLIINAAEAIPEGHVEQNQITVSGHTDAEGRVVLEVSDTGTGIPPYVVDRIFDPFFTTKAVGVGTGLGLSICHNIVTSMGGAIDVKSELGRGCTFRVTLAASSRAETPLRPEAMAAPVAALRILIIDDEPILGQSLAGLLQPKHAVQLECSAAAALARLDAGEHYDVILCDLMMPNMTGMDFQEALEARASLAAKRTLFMTGGAFTPRANTFLARLGDRVIEKPFRAADVERAITRLLRA